MKVGISGGRKAALKKKYEKENDLDSYRDEEQPEPNSRFSKRFTEVHREPPWVVCNGKMVSLVKIF